MKLLAPLLLVLTCVAQDNSLLEPNQETPNFKLISRVETNWVFIPEPEFILEPTDLHYWDSQKHVRNFDSGTEYGYIKSNVFVVIFYADQTNEVLLKSTNLGTLSRKITTEKKRIVGPETFTLPETNYLLTNIFNRWIYLRQ